MARKNKEERKLYKAAYYQANKEKIKARTAAYRKANKEFQKYYWIEYRKLHKEKLKFKDAKYKKSHPHIINSNNTKRKAVQLNAPGNGITGEQWKEIIESTNGMCTYCRQTFEKLTLDHVVPLFRGGAHDISNAVAACRSCNSSKGKKLLSEWKP